MVSCRKRDPAYTTNKTNQTLGISPSWVEARLLTYPHNMPRKPELARTGHDETGCAAESSGLDMSDDSR